MIIKYSQLELAGNLYYPVAIIIAASLLLMSLGVFLRFSNQSEQEALDQVNHNLATHATLTSGRIVSGITRQEI